MDKLSIAEAVKQICDEKGIPLLSVIETIEAALAAAYRKDFGEKNQNVKVEFDLETGKSRVFDVKEVVEDMPEEEIAEIEAGEEKEEIKKTEKLAVRKEEDKDKNVEPEEEVRRFNPKTQIQINEAKALKKSYKIGDIIKTELEIPGDFGRMAAQTAKQVIIQKLRETERETLYEEFKKQEGEVIVGTIQRKEGSLVLVDLGRLTALLPPEEQIKNENYVPGSHFKFYIVSANTTTKGPEVIVSRAHPEIIRKLFLLEIPEILSGVVEIKSVAREAGSRSKIAVWTDQKNIDPIGSCIGQRGARIQTIISELKGEKVDIVKYSDDPVEYISNALSPAKILDIEINQELKKAIARVAEDQLSLAIGRAGQNVRLAAKLTGWKIDISSKAGKIEEGDENQEDSDSEINKEESDNDSEEKEKELKETQEKKSAKKESVEKVKEEKKEKKKSVKKSKE